jgi:hypothetical protein
MMADAVRDVVGEAPINKSKVKIDVPPIVENGNSLPCTVSVERSSMRRIHSRTSSASARAPGAPAFQRASGTPTRRP